MRIWSRDLIPYLPKKQLMAMRYELGDMIKQYPHIKHGLVKFANNYDINYLFYYFRLVVSEFEKRGIKHNTQYDLDIADIASTRDGIYLCEEYRFAEDNEEYLKICLMNLYEKHIRNMIPEQEWQVIEDRFGEYL